MPEQRAQEDDRLSEKEEQIQCFQSSDGIKVGKNRGKEGEEEGREERRKEGEREKGMEEEKKEGEKEGKKKEEKNCYNSTPKRLMNFRQRRAAYSLILLSAGRDTRGGVWRPPSCALEDWLCPALCSGPSFHKLQPQSWTSFLTP